MYYKDIDTDRYTITSSGLPFVSDNKESACNAGDPGLIHRSRRSP